MGWPPSALWTLLPFAANAKSLVSPPRHLEKGGELTFAAAQQGVVWTTRADVRVSIFGSCAGSNK